jgi:hypothetical protein
MASDESRLLLQDVAKLGVIEARSLCRDLQQLVVRKNGEIGRLRFTASSGWIRAELDFPEAAPLSCFRRRSPMVVVYDFGEDQFKVRRADAFRSTEPFCLIY